MSAHRRSLQLWVFDACLTAPATAPIAWQGWVQPSLKPDQRSCHRPGYTGAACQSTWRLHTACCSRGSRSWSKSTAPTLAVRFANGPVCALFACRICIADDGIRRRLPRQVAAVNGGTHAETQTHMYQPPLLLSPADGSEPLAATCGLQRDSQVRVISSHILTVPSL